MRRRACKAFRDNKWAHDLFRSAFISHQQVASCLMIEPRGASSSQEAEHDKRHARRVVPAKSRREGSKPKKAKTLSLKTRNFRLRARRKNWVVKQKEPQAPRFAMWEPKEPYLSKNPHGSASRTASTPHNNPTAAQSPPL